MFRFFYYLLFPLRHPGWFLVKLEHLLKAVYARILGKFSTNQQVWIEKIIFSKPAIEIARIPWLIVSLAILVCIFTAQLVAYTWLVFESFGSFSGGLLSGQIGGHVGIYFSLIPAICVTALVVLLWLGFCEFWKERYDKYWIFATHPTDQQHPETEVVVVLAKEEPRATKEHPVLLCMPILRHSFFGPQILTTILSHHPRLVGYTISGLRRQCDNLVFSARDIMGVKQQFYGEYWFYWLCITLSVDHAISLREIVLEKERTFWKYHLDLLLRHFTGTKSKEHHLQVARVMADIEDRHRLAMFNENQRIKPQDLPRLKGKQGNPPDSSVWTPVHPELWKRRGLGPINKQ
ncbi:MAG: hypothetical protein ABIH21_02980 [Patescibacteria group bacterium]